MLEQLPYEFYAQLNIEDMVHLTQVNKDANKASSNSLFWQPFYHRYVDKNVKNVENPKQKILLGLKKERHLFVQYLMALSFKFNEVNEQNKSWKMTKQEKIEQLPYYYSRAAKALYENYVYEGEKYLINVIESSGFSSPTIELLQRYLSKIFNDTISGRLQPDTKNSNFNTYYDLTPFSYVFETLTKIDAPIAMRMLLDKVKPNERDVDELISQSLYFPSPKVFKIFLDRQPELVKKFFNPYGFYSWIKCSPLMMAVVGAKYYGKFKESSEIIDLLLEKGSETDFDLESLHPTIQFSGYTFRNFCGEQKTELAHNNRITSEQKTEISKILDKLISMEPRQVMTLRV